MKSSWDLRIARAGELEKQHSAATELLRFYGQLARFQKSVSDKLSRSKEHTPAVLLPFFSELLALVKQCGSDQLKQAAESQSQARGEQLLELLIAVWQHEDEVRDIAPEYLFFAKALLQPYAELLAQQAGGLNQDSPSSVCPFCGSKPEVAVLRPEGDGGRRSLVCSLCATEWNYRRQLCPNCGEEHKDKLPVFIADEFDYVRVDACDTCRAYIKSIDMTKNGRAVPIVDELASVSLNLWAQQKQYHKVEPNLFGV